RSRLSGKLLSNSDYPMSEPGGLTVMSILADCCAGAERGRVTDRGDAYATIAGFLGGKTDAKVSDPENPQEQLVPISLEVIDAPSLDLERLIEFREREEKEPGNTLRDLRHRYVASLESYVTRLTTAKTRESDAEEVKRQFADDIKKDLNNMKQELSFARNEALLSKEILVTALAGIGTVASWVFGMPVPILGVLTTGGVPAAVGGVVAARSKYLSARYSIMQKHPMAYLYEMKRDGDRATRLGPRSGRGNLFLP